MKEYLIEEKLQKSFGSVIKMASKGLVWIKENNKKLESINEENKLFEIQTHDNVTDDNSIESNKELEEKLIAYRKQKATEEGVKLYQIFPNKTIDELLKIRVSKIDDFAKINGL